MAYLLLFGGVVLLLLGGDWLVRGAVDLALRMKVDVLVVGMTVVSFATSAPELLVSLDAGIDGYTDISFGNVIGSNIANIALILGLTAVVFPITVKEKTYKSDYWIMMLATLILFLFIFWDHLLTFWESLVFVILLVAYNVFQIWASRRGVKRSREEVEGEIASEPSRNLYWMIFYLVIGILSLKFGADFLIEGAVELAESWGVSERVIGITVVSVGTSLPELAASMMASFKGEQELSLGNLIGSNIFNILAVLGITGLFVDLPVKSDQLLTFDIPFLLVTSLILYPFMRYTSRGLVNRWEGIVMFGIYALYIFLVI